MSTRLIFYEAGPPSWSPVLRIDYLPLLRYTISTFTRHPPELKLWRTSSKVIDFVWHSTHLLSAPTLFCA